MTSGRIATLAAAAIVVVACVVPQKTRAQSIAQRVASVRDGKVGFTFAAKPDVCGWGNSISRGGNQRYNWSDSQSADVEYDSECSHTPVRVVLEVRGGDITKLRTYVGGRWRPGSNINDLGTYSTKAATDYLLGLASTQDGVVGRDAIMPATLADSVAIWPALTRIARNDSRSNATRKQALFWLSTEAGDKIAGREREKSDDESEIKKQAVFALSQRRSSEAVETLMEVVRKNRDPEVRRTALFWLGQTNDPRVVTLFEEILSR